MSESRTITDIIRTQAVNGAKGLIDDASNISEFYNVLASSVPKVGLLQEAARSDDLGDIVVKASLGYAATLLLSGYIDFRKRMPTVTDFESVRMHMKISIDLAAERIPMKETEGGLEVEGTVI